MVNRKVLGADEKKRREKLMPLVSNPIAKEGQIYGNDDLGNLTKVKNKYWFSEAGRSEKFCDYYDPRINSNDKMYNPNENVLEFINKQNGYEVKVKTFAWWDVMAWILNRKSNGIWVNTYCEDLKGPNLTPLQK